MIIIIIIKSGQGREDPVTLEDGHLSNKCYWDLYIFYQSLLENYGNSSRANHHIGVIIWFVRLKCLTWHSLKDLITCMCKTPQIANQACISLSLTHTFVGLEHVIHWYQTHYVKGTGWVGLNLKRSSLFSYFKIDHLEISHDRVSQELRVPKPKLTSN